MGEQIGTERVGRAAVLAAGVLLAGLATGGCYSTKDLDAFLLDPPRPVSGLEYRVYPPDVIQVGSLRVPEINRISQQVRPDGRINLPLLGEVYVAGKTPREIEESLAQAAKGYYEEADATVEVTGYRSQNFYVFGQVGRPGPVPWTGHDSLLNVLAQVQPTTLAWPERIIVVRGDEPREGGFIAASQPSTKYKTKGVHPGAEDRPRRKILINLMAMVKSGDMSNNILLMPNDIVYVQPNPLAAVGLAIQNLLFPVRPAIEAVGAPASAAGAVVVP